MENEQNEIMWDVNSPSPRGASANIKPNIRISYQPSTKTCRMSFSGKAARLLLGEKDFCNIVIGLSRNLKSLYIKIASAEEEGSRRLNAIHNTTYPSFTTRWIGERLGITEGIYYIGEVVLRTADPIMYEVALLKKIKKSR